MSSGLNKRNKLRRTLGFDPLESRRLLTTLSAVSSGTLETQFATSTQQTGDAIAIIESDFEADGLQLSDVFDDVFHNGTTSQIISTDSYGDGTSAVEIVYGSDEDEITMQAAIFDLPEKAGLSAAELTSVEYGFASRFPEGLPFDGVQRGYGNIKQSRGFNSRGIQDFNGIGDSVFKYNAGFEGAPQDRFTWTTEVGTHSSQREVDLDPTEWYTVRYFAQRNTPGNADGVFMFWLNDELVEHSTDVSWTNDVDDPAAWIDGVWFGGNLSLGGATADQPFRRLFDDIYINVNGSVPVIGDPNPTVIVADINANIEEGGNGGSATVVLSEAPQSDVILQTISSSDQLNVSTNSLTFTAANWNVPQTVNFTAVDDVEIELAEQVSVEITVSPNSDPSWVNASADPITVTINDNDTRQDAPGYQQGVFVAPGNASENVTLDFEWLQRLGEYANELGFFVAEDISGTVDGVATTDSAYAQTALSDDSREVIFASGLGTGAQAAFTVPGGSYVVFYMIQNDSTQSFISSNPGNDFTQFPRAFFSTFESNPDDFDHVRATTGASNTWQFGWEDIEGGGDRSFTDAVIELEVLPASPSEKLVAFDLVVLHANGSEVSNETNPIAVGQTFDVQVRARDLRTNASGVFSIYTDITYDPSLVRPAGEAVFNDLIGARNGDFTSPGTIDELGGIVSQGSSSPSDLLVATIPFRAIGPGNLAFLTDPADQDENETTIFGSSSAVDDQDIAFGSRFVEIAESGNLHNHESPLDVNGDGIVSPLDALMVINYLDDRTQDSTGDSTTDAAINRYVDTNNDGNASAIDALLVINEIARRSQVTQFDGEKIDDPNSDDNELELLDEVISQLF